MKLPTSPSTLLVAAVLLLPRVSADETTTTITTNLRGKVVHRRTVYAKVEDSTIYDDEVIDQAAEPLVDPPHAVHARKNVRGDARDQPNQNTQHHPKNTDTSGTSNHNNVRHAKVNAAPVEPHNQSYNAPAKEHHHYVRVQGKDSHGGTRSILLDLDKLEDNLPHDAPIFTKNHHHFHNDEKKADRVSGEESQMTAPSRASSPTPGATRSPHGHHFRVDHNIHHENTHNQNFESHVEVERHHEHHNKAHHHPHNKTAIHDKEVHHDNDRSMYALPTGLSSHFNETLFDELHDAPFRVYSEALGHQLNDDESFPVFALPQWLNTTGVFTGFSKSGIPLIFENVQFLLHWDEIVSASNSPVPSDLEEHIDESNFHASLIIGKSVGNGANVPFIGMIISYYQFGSLKNVLVPFSKLEDFFDDTSEKHLLDPNTKSLEMDALHHMLEKKRGNSSSFYHPALAHTEERKAQLEDLEINHFQKVFQLLIRRTVLFSFGYADCLLNEPRGLRNCLDETFYNLIKMETSVRGALDDEIVEQLAEINDTFHAKVREACISVQGSGTGIMYGSGSCHNANDIGAFFGNYGSF